MVLLIFLEGGEPSVSYLLPAPEALDFLALTSWANLVQQCYAERQKGNKDYATRILSSIAAAYEIQSCQLDHKTSVLSKAVFFRKLALALARKAKSDTIVALETKYAFSLLVKATFVNAESLAIKALQQARSVISLEPRAADLRMLLARMLIWAVCDADASDNPLDDLTTAIKYIEECMAEAPNQFDRTYGADQNLQRAYQARYTLQGDDAWSISYLSSMPKEDHVDPEGSVDSTFQRLSVARQCLEANQSSLHQEVHTFQVEDPDDPAQEEEEEEQDQELCKFHYTMQPSLAKEALEAGLLACQSPVKVEDSRREPASKYIIGSSYLARSLTGKTSRNDLEKAISFLEAAQKEEPLDSTEGQEFSVFLAYARWTLGNKTQDIALRFNGMNSMALLLDQVTDDVLALKSVVIGMMESSYHFWTITGNGLLLKNAAKFASWLLHEDRIGILQPNALFLILCISGQIAADTQKAQLETLLQEPLTYWDRCWQDRRANLNFRLHARHLAAQYLSKQECYEDAFQHAKTSVELIRFACPAHLDTSERESLILLLNGISVDACALAIKLGRHEEALELLEQGRGILNFLPDAFADSLNELHQQQPELYAKFDRCRQSILASMNFQDVSETKENDIESRNENIGDDCVHQMISVLAEIRQKPHFKYFYRPIVAAEMQSLATKNPVVVLVGSPLLPCAVIVKQDSIQSVDLSPRAVTESPSWDVDSIGERSNELSLIIGRELIRIDLSDGSQVRTQTEKLSHAERAHTLDALLSFLWVAVVEPINRILGYEGPNVEEYQGIITLSKAIETSLPNRVTWIRTGTFSRMPVHMARDDIGMPFISRAISSYVASFRSLSLSHSRQRTAKRGLEDGLFVTMPSTVSRPPQGSPFLKAENVAAEVSAVMEAAKSINWSSLERPSAQQVRERFANARFVHVICHGVENPQYPERSHLKLWQDTRRGKGRVDPLYVSDISTWMTRKTSVVFLSACSVADPGRQELSDENPDIANSFAVAGVPNVVGSMWEVETSVATAVARLFWSFLDKFFPEGGVLTGELVACALHVAVIITAGDWRGDPLMWAGFIHIGGMGSGSLANVRGDSDNKNDDSGDENDDSGDENGHSDDEDL